MLFRLQFSSHYFLEPPKSERAAVCIVFSALVRSNFLQTSMEYHKLMSIFKGPAWYQLHRVGSDEPESHNLVVRPLEVSLRTQYVIEGHDGWKPTEDGYVNSVRGKEDTAKYSMINRQILR
ncbi:hypothetical protein EAE96_002503 [Botrytis aclada]|nr:hypothetical protein EAE96_002503 [Botrytis aclada]